VYLAGLAVFLLRMAFSYWFTARLVRASRPIHQPWASEIYESPWIAVPMTTGWHDPRILLPEGWEQWDGAKLQAVLAHEQNHVQRSDCAIAFLAGLNRCVFWFHPLAWWLERELAGLAEQACDDAALLQMGAREDYAEALLDMAKAVRMGRGRLVWEAVAMAKVSEVRLRIERILDETRQIRGGIGAAKWTALAVCGLPLIYLASVAQPVPARAQQPPNAVQRAVVDAGRMEQDLAANPEDLELRGRLIGHYFLKGAREPRVQHIFWLIEHHPEADITGAGEALIAPGPSALNSEADFQRAALLWSQAVRSNLADPRVLANAAAFQSQPGADWYTAERLLRLARALEPGDPAYTRKLAHLYANAILAASDGRSFPIGESNLAFGEAARQQMENSTDGPLLLEVGNQLMDFVRLPGNRSLAPVDLGQRLRIRAQEAGTQPAASPSAPILAIALAPRIVSKVDPVYPETARRGGISGSVELRVIAGPGGRVASVRCEYGHPLLIQAAVDAVRQWVFQPVLQNGVAMPVAFSISVPVRPAFTAVAASAAVLQRIRVGERVQAAKLLHRVEPDYPRGPGEVRNPVVLAVTIDPQGMVQRAEAVDGNPALAAAAERAVRQWIYAPTSLNGQPIAVATTVTLNFN
jgi:TonB family protein